ncbi:octopamine receptor Oamb isoform X1 [Drosophila yakuba]|uniref:octopamine receptor Oamb isoform X1 n=1 Tax=Drosophila yakuba TaxID=7245 RepID=UPI0019307535|nr:octopamine receptor Oamb isoform X1 [Drosophila yakuba]
MNETECEDLIKSVKWTEPANLISLAVLEFINVLVIGGNCLVIAAVFCSNKLRSVTNFFIVNLAVADLLVGLAVLPFSATWEVFKVWIFGDLWCRIWLAVDVWMCTASILNLCAISLDRYVAVTRPVTYPSIMSTKKAKSLIAGIWVLSFFICFPPLVGWKDQKAVIQPTYPKGNHTLYYTTTMSSSEDGQLGLDSIKDQGETSLPPFPPHVGNGNAYNPYDPDFAPIDGSGEIRIAAMGSTSTPATTTSTTTSSSASTTETEMDLDLLNAPPQNRPQTISGSCPWKCELTNDRGYVLYSALGSFYIPMFVMLFFYWRIYRAAVRTTRAINQGFKTTKGSKGIGSRFEEQRLTLRIHRGRGSNQQDSMHSNGSTQSTTTTLGTPSPERLSKYATRRLHHHDKIKISVSYPSSENINELAGHGHGDVGRERRPSGNALYAVHYNGTNGRESTESQLYRQQQHGVASSCYLQVGKGLPELARRQSNTSEAGGSGHSRPANKKMGRRNIKAQVKRFRMETKAAKTLAIIVGMFIFCWCPFFTMYIIRPFCQDCVDPLLFSVLFWLGYCNSAVNPMIYALFSKDFRFAFKRIICRCFCSRQSVSLKSSRRGSDMSAIRIRARTPSITPSAAAHSFGDESELHHSEMSNDPR